jgi:hypothetical protein
MQGDFSCKEMRTPQIENSWNRKSQINAYVPSARIDHTPVMMRDAEVMRATSDFIAESITSCAARMPASIIAAVDLSEALAAFNIAPCSDKDVLSMKRRF